MWCHSLWLDLVQGGKKIRGTQTSGSQQMHALIMKFTLRRPKWTLAHSRIWKVGFLLRSQIIKPHPKLPTTTTITTIYLQLLYYVECAGRSPLKSFTAGQLQDASYSVHACLGFKVRDSVLTVFDINFKHLKCLHNTIGGVKITSDRSLHMLDTVNS